MSILKNTMVFFDVRTVLMCVAILLVLSWFWGRPKNLPPGPWGYPLIGSFPAIAREIRRGVEPQNLFIRYAAKYGPVFRLKIFNKTMVVLHDYASVKEAFQHPQLQDRPKMLLTELLEIDDVSSSSGQAWFELRRFCLTGLGKTSFEEKIGTEAEELMKEMSAFNGKPFDPKPLLRNAVSNVICSVVFGKRYNYTDKEFHQLLILLDSNFKLLGAGGAVNFFPTLRYLPYFSIDEIKANFKEIREFVSAIIDNHRANIDADNVKDFIDSFLMESKENEASGVKDSPLNEDNLVGTITAMFAAGSQTISITLQWAFLYMAAYPEIQQRVQAEIDDVIGRNRLPKMTDKPALNFTLAVIWEVQRLGFIAPLGVAHAAASDTQFRGFTIPKDTFIVPNLWAITHNPKVFPEPDQFKPERFLNDKGEAVEAEEMIPFSVGRRSCVAEHLAKMELFIFFSFFLHQFTFKKPDDSPPLSLKGTGWGLSFSSSNFEICVIKRE